LPCCQLRREPSECRDCPRKFIAFLGYSRTPIRESCRLCRPLSRTFAPVGVQALACPAAARRLNRPPWQVLNICGHNGTSSPGDVIDFSPCGGPRAEKGPENTAISCGTVQHCRPFGCERRFSCGFWGKVHRRARYIRGEGQANSRRWLCSNRPAKGRFAVWGRIPGCQRSSRSPVVQADSVCSGALLLLGSPRRSLSPKRTRLAGTGRQAHRASVV